MANRLALLIDGENIAAKYFPEIARHCLKHGALHSAQVFADFSENRRSAWLEVCREFGVQPVLQLSRKGKNSVDIAMTIAAMDILHAGATDTICLVSSDRDFIPLAQRLRSTKLQVLGIGLSASDKVLADSCDQFFLLDAVPKATKPPPALNHDEQAFMRDLIAEVCAASGQKAVHPANVMSEVQRRKPALADRLGKGKFLKHLRSLGLIVEHDNGTSKLISARAA